MKGLPIWTVTENPSVRNYYCPRCGSKLPDGKDDCTSCGHRKVDQPMLDIIYPIVLVPMALVALVWGVWRWLL